jgi:hypothetical protein
VPGRVSGSVTVLVNIVLAAPARQAGFRSPATYDIADALPPDTNLSAVTFTVLIQAFYKAMALEKND